MEAAPIPASRRGSTQSRGKLAYGGQRYRFQKALAVGKLLRKCVKAWRNFKRTWFSVTDGSVAGADVLRPGSHAAHFAPIASMADVARIRQDVRANAFIAGPTPPLTVAQWLAKSPPPRRRAFDPPLASRRRSAQNASYRAQKKAHAAGRGGVSPNYNSLEEISLSRPRSSVGPVARISSSATAVRVQIDF